MEALGFIFSIVRRKQFQLSAVAMKITFFHLSESISIITRENRILLDAVKPALVALSVTVLPKS